MATSRRFRLLAGFTAALLMVVGGATASFADQLALDGDGVTPLNSGGAAQVVACPNQPVQFNVLIAALRQGPVNQNAFKNGAQVTVSYTGSTIGATATLADATIQLPANWEAERARRASPPSRAPPPSP